MIKKLLLILFVIPSMAFSQSKNLRAGLELDLLPYATGGYFAGGWLGTDQLRVRGIIASVNIPEFLIPDDFTNNKIKAYAAVIDYSLTKNWTGWFAGTGLVKWNGTIQSRSKIQTASYKTYLLNGTLGYNLKLNKYFYISPWAGLHLKIAGEGNVSVDGEIYRPPLFNPEASIKVGVMF